MSPIRFALALAAGLAVSCIAAAHDDFPGTDWCTNGTIALTGEFAFTRAELYAEVQRRQEAASTGCIGRPTASIGGPVGHCGIFDPPYEAARSIARAACGASESAAAPANDIVAIVRSPPSFNAENHHEIFNLEEGINGICGVCVPLTAPAGPRQN